MTGILVVSGVFLVLTDAVRAEDRLFLECRSADGRPVASPVSAAHFSVRLSEAGQAQFSKFNVERREWTPMRCDAPVYNCTYTRTLIGWERNQDRDGEPLFRVTLSIDRAEGAFTAREFNYGAGASSLNWEQKGVCQRASDPALQVPETAF
jgi:hypothetical protein